jgi:hypothetical protein
LRSCGQPFSAAAHATWRRRRSGRLERGPCAAESHIPTLDVGNLMDPSK